MSTRRKRGGRAAARLLAAVAAGLLAVTAPWAARPGAAFTIDDAKIVDLENLAHLDQVPASGATLIALPMKIAGGSGGPVRAIAVLP